MAIGGQRDGRGMAGGWQVACGLVCSFLTIHAFYPGTEAAQAMPTKLADGPEPFAILGEKVSQLQACR